MAIPCVTVTVTAAPVNIIAMNITVSTNACTEPCGVTVDVTWKNTGGTAGTFSPSVKVDGATPVGLPLPEETLGPDATVTKTISVTGLMVGTHTICPDPN